MKTIFLLIILSAGCLAVDAYTIDIEQVVQQLSKLDSVGSDHVGYAGSPHRFYELYQYCFRLSTDDDLLAMLHDKSPAVRVMGAKCILTGASKKFGRKEVEPLLYDIAKLQVGPGGCTFRTMTVSDVVYEMRKDQNYLGSSAGPGTP